MENGNYENGTHENGTHEIGTHENGTQENGSKITPANAVNGQLLHDEVIEALKSEAERRGLTNPKLDISSGSSKGDNFMGIVAKVKVTGIDSNSKEVTWNWIAKAAPQTDLYRTLLKIDLAYSREVYVYETVFPLFDKFQTEKQILNPFIDHPKFVLSYIKPYKESFVMEDLKTEGYIMRNKKIPLDLNHVKLAMKAYARLHALSFALRDQMPEEFEKIAKEAVDRHFVPEDGDKFEEMLKYQDQFTDKILDAMDPETDSEAIKSLKYYARDATNINIEAVQTTSKYSVIGHGDSWTNNFLWKYEDPTCPDIPTKICLLDWQLARYGSPALDLGYFIFACTDQAFRDQHYDHMIDLYYYTLCAQLVELGTDPEKVFPYSAFQSELKRHMVFGFYMASMVLNIIVSESDEVPEFGASADVDQFVKAFDYKSVNDDLFKDRVRGVVLQMHRKGYFDFLKE